MPYPNEFAQAQQLITQHRQLEQQPLLLAVYYAQGNDPDGVYLLEIISEFGYNEVSDDQDMFEMEYGSTAGFPLPTGSHLHILLTNPVEFSIALRQGWPALAPLKSAIEQGNYRVVYQEGEGMELMAALQEDRVAA